MIPCGVCRFWGVLNSGCRFCPFLLGEQASKGVGSGPTTIMGTRFTYTSGSRKQGSLVLAYIKVLCFFDLFLFVFVHSYAPVLAGALVGGGGFFVFMGCKLCRGLLLSFRWRVRCVRSCVLRVRWLVFRCIVRGSFRG